MLQGWIRSQGIEIIRKLYLWNYRNVQSVHSQTLDICASECAMVKGVSYANSQTCICIIVQHMGMHSFSWNFRCKFLLNDQILIYEFMLVLLEQISEIIEMLKLVQSQMCRRLCKPRRKVLCIQIKRSIGMWTTAMRHLKTSQ